MPKSTEKKLSKKAPTKTVAKIKRPSRVMLKKADAKETVGTPVKLPDIKSPVLGVDGKQKGTMQLPKEFFAAKINKQLLAQAIRVYLTNQRQGNAATKTRSHVEGSTRKIYRQKGTGRARHGGIRSPIFVGGGIVFGPSPRDYHLDMPKKMKRRALAGALTSQFNDQIITIVDGLDTIELKTKIMAKTLMTLGALYRTLLVTPGKTAIVRAVRNISYVDTLPVGNISAYTVLHHKRIIFMKQAVLELSKTFAF
ncbi:50S ribosomal protein L4 [Candidatus Gottesmanbacteria bacterium]|nr:50S ribosomal protein L4 [Candidatus Gottesmanbacteria bacterium]